MKVPTNGYSESGSRMTEKKTTFQGIYSVNIMKSVPTFLYDQPPEPCRENTIQTIPAFVYDRWNIPFFNIWLPEIRPLAARGNCLIPNALACDANVARDEKADDAGKLRSYKEYGDVW